jgi:O-antigen/teichoic acid export membrane protein
MGLLLPLIYGRDFVDAINPARLLIIGSALSGLSSILEQSLKAQGRPFIGLSGKIASLFVMLFVSYIVVDKLYTSGICIAYICGQITCLIIMIITSSKHYKKRLNIKDYMPIKFIEIVGSYKNQ